MKLYAVMYWLDSEMDPSDTCLCYEIYARGEIPEPCIYQTRDEAEKELKRQIKLYPKYPHAVFEMSNEIARIEL